MINFNYWIRVRGRRRHRSRTPPEVYLDFVAVISDLIDPPAAELPVAMTFLHVTDAKLPWRDITNNLCTGVFSYVKPGDETEHNMLLCYSFTGKRWRYLRSFGVDWARVEAGSTTRWGLQTAAR